MRLCVCLCVCVCVSVQARVVGVTVRMAVRVARCACLQTFIGDAVTRRAGDRPAVCAADAAAAHVVRSGGVTTGRRVQRFATRATRPPARSGGGGDSGTVRLVRTSASGTTEVPVARSRGIVGALSPRVLRALAASAHPASAAAPGAAAPAPLMAPDPSATAAGLARPRSPITSSRAASAAGGRAPPSGDAQLASTGPPPARPRTAASAGGRGTSDTPRPTIFFAARPASAAPRRGPGDESPEGVATAPVYAEEESAAIPLVAARGRLSGFTSEYFTEPAAAKPPRTATHRGRAPSSVRVFKCAARARAPHLCAVGVSELLWGVCAAGTRQCRRRVRCPLGAPGRFRPLRFRLRKAWMRTAVPRVCTCRVWGDRNRSRPRRRTRRKLAWVRRRRER